MCFRPAGTAMVVKCLDCGSFNKPDNEVCQKCGVDLTASKEAAANAPAPSAGAPTQAAPGTPPAAPNAPKAPGAPTAPPKKP
jgi:hypothetical protein